MIVELAIGTYLSAVSAYALTLSVAGAVRRRRTPMMSVHHQNRFAVLIPAYKEDGVIVSVAEEALKQSYPANNFDVIIIADSLRPDTLEKLAKLPVKVVEVHFEKSTKVKALCTALAQLDEQQYDIAVILDADNIMDQNFLYTINVAYNSGHHVVQGRRMAKNMDSSFAVLDAFSEIVNNHIFRKGSQALGLSSPFIGSGMAFPLSVLKTTLSSMNSIGGFDRELQVRMVEQGYKIKYLEEATLLDEKVSKPEVFGNQRRRWLSSQLVYIRRFFKKGMRALLKGDADLFNMAILNNIMLPRVMVLGMLTGLSALAAVFSKYLDVPYYFWLSLLAANVLAIVLAVPLKFYNKDFLSALLSVPQAFMLMTRSLLKVKGANKEFIHTPHTSQG